ncbi:Tropinone reductase-like 3 [Holothuria leucospilota]|uniref:Tropinone reductase-like 3 n=1 Tax=Holothuria leucospilota TaxID=206669 RepID=A0A9Q1H983_HOLLE|nr:Tropinone reductase-like 3 [Holothuria leucospilota]
MAVATKHATNGAFKGGLLYALNVNCLFNNIRKSTMKTRTHACHMTSVTYNDEYLKKRFTGKVAICTASTAGIGYSAAERIAREGAKVVICSRRQENVDDAVKKLRNQNLEVSGIVCHQAKKEDRQRLVDYVSD